MPSPAKHKWFVAVSVVAATTIGLWINRYRPQPTVAAEPVTTPHSTESRVRVEVIHPSLGGMARKTLQPGSAHSFESAEIYAKVSGYLKEQYVDIGTRVEKGKLLAEIEVPELLQEIEREKALLRQAVAEVSQAESNIKSIIAERNATQALIAQAEANVARYESEREFKDKQYQRIRELHSLNSIEERLVDEKLDQLNAARSAETAARSAVLTAQQQALAAAARVAHAESELAVAKAKVDVAQAVLDKTSLLAAFSKVTSPYDGIVTQRHYHRGAFIRSADQGGDVPLFSVDRVDVMRVVVQVPDRDVPYTQVGDKARIAFDALPNRPFESEIARLLASENPESRTMRVEVDLKNPEELIRDGMYGHVEIDLEPPAKGLTIPSSCLVGAATRESAKVYVAHGGLARLTQVAIGKDTGTEVEVITGLTAENQVVLSPSGALTDGTPVEATPFQPKTSGH
ncbi:MAG: efflux RND transporter periplasmic adaptor subunit [Pirellulales bacterium]